MTATFFSNALDWKKLGYFAPSLPIDNRGFKKNLDYIRWLRLERILDQVKGGDFNCMPEVLELYADARTAVFPYVCSCLLGDAGTPECFERIIKELSKEEAEPDRNKILDYCSILITWGQLSVVPVILEQYKILRRQDSTLIMALNLSSLLEEGEWGSIASEPEIEELDNYAEKVMFHYKKQKEIFVSN